MIPYIATYMGALVVYSVLDLSWASLLMKDFYQSRIGPLFHFSVNIPALVLFYLLFVLGLLYFVVYPAQEKGSFPMLLISATLYGLVTYGTYDLVSMGTVAFWPLSLTMVDILWGVSVSVLVSSVAYFIATYFA